MKNGKKLAIIASIIIALLLAGLLGFMLAKNSYSNSKNVFTVTKTDDPNLLPPGSSTITVATSVTMTVTNSAEGMATVTTTISGQTTFSTTLTTTVVTTVTHSSSRQI